MSGLRPTPILKTPPTRIRHQSQCSIVTNVFLHFSCSLKHAGSIIAMAAGFGMYWETGQAYFCRHQLHPPPPHSPQDTRGQSSTLGSFHTSGSIMSARPFVRACVRACVCCILYSACQTPQIRSSKSLYKFPVPCTRSIAVRCTNWGLANEMLCDTLTVFNIHDTRCILGES